MAVAAVGGPRPALAVKYLYCLLPSCLHACHPMKIGTFLLSKSSKSVVEILSTHGFLLPHRNDTAPEDDRPASLLSISLIFAARQEKRQNFFSLAPQAALILIVK